MRRILAVFALLAVLGGGAWMALGRPLAVETVKPATGGAVTVYGLGTVEARILSKLGFEVTGSLVELAADHGEQVAAGKVLARLDDREQRAKLAQATAQHRQAEAGLAQAQARLERARATLAQKRSVNVRRQTLAKDGTVSTEAAEDANAAAGVAIADVAVATADLEAAQGSLENARAQVQREEALLAKFTLAAPYDAILVERSKELGSVLPAGTAVFTVADPATIWVRAYVDEAQAGALAVGQAATLLLRSLPGSPFQGKVSRIDIESDRISEERRVHVAFDAIPAEFHLGEQAEAVVTVGRADRGLLIPASAVIEARAGEAAVWLVKDGILARRPIRVLRRLADGAVEVEGLRPEEILAARPRPEFVEGRRVREKTP